MKPLTAFALFAGGAYYLDVIRRPALVAQRARAAASRRGKPLLNVGAGTKGSSVRVAVLGPTRWGDVNCDLAGRDAACGGPAVCPCDIEDLPFDDGTFGAVIASHVLEHVRNPGLALAELARVADEVFVVTPPWWAPHTWLHPGHLWFVDPAGKFHPLWQDARRAARAVL